MEDLRFLMHRVELKAQFLRRKETHKTTFLMHRVELKGLWADYWQLCPCVPNAPCGVERPLGQAAATTAPPFLMHRVELKETKAVLAIRAFLRS